MNDNTPDVEKRLTPILQRLLEEMKEGKPPPGFDPSNEEEFERLTPPLPVWEEYIPEDQDAKDKQTEEDKRDTDA